MRKSEKITLICKFCGKEFLVKPSLANKLFCCRQCANEFKKQETIQKKTKVCPVCGKSFYSHNPLAKYCSKECSAKGRTTQVEKTCLVCGKKFKVIKCRENTAFYCSKECLNKALEKLLKYVCALCGTEFYRKPHDIRGSEQHFCSKECLLQHKHEIMSGEGNHLFGLKGDKNSSYKEGALIKKNGKSLDKFIYKPEHPQALLVDRNGRIAEHVYNVVVNYNKFNECFFVKKGNYYILNPDFKLNVHHIDRNHLNNDVNNLTILTIKQHTKCHNLINSLSEEVLRKIIGVLKLGELLENLEVDNQQPSFERNLIEGSETNNRVLLGNAKDSNVDTSALLNNIKNIINDYIVQTSNITEEAYKASIQEIEERQIKS